MPSLLNARHLQGLVIGSAVVLVALTVALIFSFLVIGSIPILTEVPLKRFFTDPGWYPTDQEYNLVPMIVGSLSASIGAMMLTIPLGIGAAVGICYFLPSTIAKGVLHSVQVFAGVPSVIYGLWGLTVLVPILNAWQPPGTSLLCGIIILGLMTIPTMTLLVHAQLRQMGQERVRQAEALGLGRWDALRLSVFPDLGKIVTTAGVLSYVRALGETMAVVMVAGNIVQVPSSLFAPIRTLTANIALEMAYASQLHYSALIVTGLVLLLVVTAMVLLTEGLNYGQR